MDRRNYQQSVENDYLEPSPDIPYYINLAVAGDHGIVIINELLIKKN